LRPLLDPHGRSGASQVSREHHLYSSPGFVTIAGGKLTTYRRMAAEALDHALLQNGPAPKCTTHTRPLPGSDGLAAAAPLDPLALAPSAGGLAPAPAAALVMVSGVRSAVLAAPEAADPTAQEAIDPELPWTMAQVDEAIEHELAITLDDVLSRRVPVLLRARDQGLGVAQKVATRMAAGLGWSEERTAEELSCYRAAVDVSRRFRA
jgi:glycerol-3-phosphate dehydrogenase